MVLAGRASPPSSFPLLKTRLGPWKCVGARWPRGGAPRQRLRRCAPGPAAMADNARYSALCRAGLRLEYLYANSTTHNFLFGAIAELIDNSRDAGATRLDIYTVKNENLQGGYMLCLLDDGCGMSPRKTVDLVYFGRSSKRANPDMIGCYGNGLKSGSMRIGKDLLLFTKEENTVTCLLLSQTFCETEGLSEIIVPILSWSSQTRELIIRNPETLIIQLSIIYKYSPFKNNAALMKQFDAIYGKTGTLLIIYNMKLTLNGEPELDILTDREDMLLTVAPENLPEKQSLRAYAAILYLEPRMKIFIQTKEVETKCLPYCFYRPRMYPYISSAFKHIARKELQKAEADMKAAEDAVKEAQCALKHSEGSLFQKRLELALTDAVEKEMQMRETLKDKQRNLRKPKKLFLTFGINILNRSQYGMLIYSNKRLIKMFEKVGPQKNKGSYFGAGAVGIVDVPSETMEPTHNKQAFVNAREYNHLLKAMENCLIQYWKDMGLSQREEAIFWNSFGYMNNKWSEKPSESIQYKRRRAMEIPNIVQCVICLKWRRVPYDIDINHGRHHSIWNCTQNPNPLENKCDVPECLPLIPLGTFNPTQNNKQKLIVDAIRQREWRLGNTQQKLHLIQPHTIVQPTADSNTPKDKMLCQKNASHKDPHPACGHLIKSSTNKRHTENSSHQMEPPAKQMTCPERRQHLCQEEKYSLSVMEKRKDHDISKVSPMEIRDEKPCIEKPECNKTDADNKREIICIVISDSDTEVTSNDDNIVFTEKEKQDKGAENGGSEFSPDSCFGFEKNHLPPADLESGSKETSEDNSKEHVFVAEKKCNDAVSYTCGEPQSVYENEMVETLTARIKEMLLHFLPKCNLSREHLSSMSTEDILAIFQLSRDPERNAAAPVDFKQYLLKYEEQLSEKNQSRSDLAICAAEKKISLCERQIKVAEGKLKRLQEKAVQFLLRFYPNFQIHNQEDVGDVLEKILKQHRLENTGPCK